MKNTITSLMVTTALVLIPAVTHAGMTGSRSMVTATPSVPMVYSPPPVVTVPSVPVVYSPPPVVTVPSVPPVTPPSPPACSGSTCPDCSAQVSNLLLNEEKDGASFARRIMEYNIPEAFAGTDPIDCTGIKQPGGATGTGSDCTTVTPPGGGAAYKRCKGYSCTIKIGDNTTTVGPFTVPGGNDIDDRCLPGICLTKACK